MNLDFQTVTNNDAKEIAFNKLIEMKEVVISTVGKDGNPASRIVDLMLRDENSLYFLTCNIKPFYFELKDNNKIAITAMTKDFLQIRIQAQVETVSLDMLEKIYKKNPSFGELIPAKSESNNMEVFKIHMGKGELFDLNDDLVKMQRVRFDFAGGKVNAAGCTITEACINCGKCASKCPFGAITKNEIHEINRTYCDECGICYNICPTHAIELPLGM